MASDEIKQQINQKEKELEKWKAQLDRLFQEKAQTSGKLEDGIGDRDVLVSRINRLDGEISAAKSNIEFLPYQIKELKSKLLEAEMRETEIAKIIPKQQELVDEIVQASKLLVEQLRLAKNTNDELKLRFERYHIYRGETGKNLLPKKGVCSPSKSWLSCIYGVLSQEVEGKRPHRTLGIGANMPL